MSLSSPTPTTSFSLTSPTFHLAMTTPFTPRPDCTYAYETITTSFSGDLIAYPAIYSNPANALYADCQPSGISTIEPSLRTFSPAICPSGWDYNALNVTSNGLSTTTTATCCSSGDHLSAITNISGLEYLTSACVHSPRPTYPYSTLTTTTTTDIVKIYPGYTIQWDIAENNILTPYPLMYTYPIDLSGIGIMYTIPRGNGNYLPSHTTTYSPIPTSTYNSTYLAEQRAKQEEEDAARDRRRSRESNTLVACLIAIPTAIAVLMFMGCVWCCYGTRCFANCCDGSGRRGEEKLVREQQLRRRRQDGEGSDENPPSFEDVERGREEEALPAYEPRREDEQLGNGEAGNRSVSEEETRSEVRGGGGADEDGRAMRLVVPGRL